MLKKINQSKIIYIQMKKLRENETNSKNLQEEEFAEIEAKRIKRDLK